jgi:hypothetical protein
MLKHCAANRKRQLSPLPNVGPYIYIVKISGFTRSSIYDIKRAKGSQNLRQSPHEGGKVVSPLHQVPLPPGNIPGTHFS